MKTIRFGIIGGGLMGREFASASARWCHLTGMRVRPQIVAVCSRHPENLGWFRENLPDVTQITGDYRAVLANPAVEAVYVALPHHLHREVYCAAIIAGKHLMGEKPFGMNRSDCDAIAACARDRPACFVRCSSQFPFFPAVQRIGVMLERGAFGRIIEAQTGFLHSNDLDPNKPINWKRQAEFNGEYGVLADLGMHACHLPFRAGWMPRNVRAVLADIVTERPDGQGGRAPCSTWDNATLLCETIPNGAAGAAPFPWIVRTHRIAPGEKNNWYLEILGTQASARWSSSRSDILEILQYDGGEQFWRRIQVGCETAFPTITGGIFQFGFTDAILQMWAAFLYEFSEGPPLRKFAACATLEEAALSHRLFTAALESQKHQAVAPVTP